MICRPTPELVHQDTFDFLGNQMSMTENGHAAIFEVKFGSKTNGATEASPGRQRPSVHPKTALSRQRVALMTPRRDNLLPALVCPD